MACKTQACVERRQPDWCAALFFGIAWPFHVNMSK